MPNTPTPGEVCYEAYSLEMENTRPAGLGRWASLEARVRAAWEAAAAAAIAWWIATPLPAPAPAPEETHD